MGKEHNGGGVPEKGTGVRVTSIRLDLQTRSVTLATEGLHLATLRLAPDGLIFEASGHPRAEHDTPIAPSVPPPSPNEASEPSSSSPAETEKPKATTLQGKLKGKPRQGRPDARGNPTAWARFAAHEPDLDGAHLYSATFHRHTAGIALSLDKDAALTVQGYPHEQDNPGSQRMDTLSVINILDYPGKPRAK